MRHARPLTRVAEAALSPLQAKMEFIAGVVDVAIALIFQKDAGAL